jgi:hypothetical protein
MWTLYHGATSTSCSRYSQQATEYEACLKTNRRTACAHAQFSGCSSTTNVHSETGRTAVCCQNLTLCALSSRSALSLLVGAIFKKFILFLNTSFTFKQQPLRFFIQEMFLAMDECTQGPEDTAFLLLFLLLPLLIMMIVILLLLTTSTITTTINQLSDVSLNILSSVDVISGFSRNINKILAVLGCYASYICIK